MFCGTSSSLAAQQVDKKTAVVNSPHIDFYVLDWLSAVIPLFVMTFQLLFCIAD